MTDRLYLHTAWYRPFGLVLLKAMTAGLPCVVLDGKGNRDLIEHGQNRYMIDKQDPCEFAASIRERTSSPGAYEAMPAYALEYAGSFDIGRVADRFIAFYHHSRAKTCSHK